jgi:signal transduction histidine kinase
MLRRRPLVYFSVAAAVAIAAAVGGEIFLVGRVIGHSRRADLRFANGVAHHVNAALADEARQMRELLEALPLDEGAPAVRAALRVQPQSMFEPGGLWVFRGEDAPVGVESPASQLPPREVLLPALRAARQSNQLAVTSLWVGVDGAPRITMVQVGGTPEAWRALVGNVRLDQQPFLSHFGFYLSDSEVRLQLLDAAGMGLFSTEPAERYRSVVHGTYLLDGVRQGQSGQLKCHACHEGKAGETTREDELATLAPVKGTQWSVLVRENPAQLRQVLNETAGTVVALVSMILGAFTGFYWLLTHRVLKPLRQLATAAVAVHAATPSNEPPSASRDDMKEVARSFEPMLAPAGTAGGSRPALAQPTATAPPGALRDALKKALATAVHGYRHIENVSALVVSVEGEALDGPLLVVGTLGEGSEPVEAVLRRLGHGKSTVECEELLAAGIDPAKLQNIEAFYRRSVRALHILHGDVWVGVSDTAAARQLKPMSVLIAMHVQGILDRSLLSDTLWQEYREKSRMLGHLFEAETEERKRIAREIHDDTAQALAALALKLEAFPVGRDLEAQQAAVRTAQERLRGIIDSTDRIMKRLRPALLDDLGLADAVRALGEDVLVGAGIDFELDAPDKEIAAAPEIEDAVFRVFQEAASNVVRHAQARNVSASLELVGGKIVGSFEDDGQGLQTPPSDRAGDRPRFGLLGMRERITQLGGEIQLSASESGGVRIDVTVPYRAAERPQHSAGAAP